MAPPKPTGRSCTSTRGGTPPAGESRGASVRTLELDRQTQRGRPEIWAEFLRDQMTLLIPDHHIAPVEVDPGRRRERKRHAAAEMDAEFLLGLVLDRERDLRLIVVVGD